MSHYVVIINIIGFQVGWFACVISAANNQPETGIIIALIVIALHIYISKNKTTTLLLLLIVTLFGGTWDSILTFQNILQFNSGIFSPFLAPSWIFIMWTLFATTLNVSLGWLYGHYFYAMIIGAICGPLVYQGGAALGAVVIPQTYATNILLAIAWSLILPLMILLSEIIEKYSLVEATKK